MFGNMIAFSCERDALLKGNMSHRNDDGKTEKHTRTHTKRLTLFGGKKSARARSLPPDLEC